MKKHLCLMLAIVALSTTTHAQIQGAKNLGAATSDAIGGAADKAGGGAAGGKISGTRAGQNKNKSAKPMTSQARYRMLRHQYVKPSKASKGAAAAPSAPAAAATP